MAALLSQLRAHIDAWFAASAREEFSWRLGPIGTALPDFRVARFDPATPEAPWAYVSLGASEVEREGERTEFLIVSPEESPRHVETLAMVTYFHADPRYGLTEGAIVDIGRPWLEGSAADHLLVSRPLPYGPDFEWLETSNGVVRFLWLVPITSGEAEFARQQGTAALEDALEAGGVNVIDGGRPAVV